MNAENLDYDKMNAVDLETNLEEALLDEDMTEEEMEMSRKLIERISGYYLRKEADVQRKKKIKAKRRKANAVASKSRAKNRGK